MNRYTAAGALALALGLFAAPAAVTVAAADELDTNKAQVEYRKQLTLVDPSATSSQLTTARVDHLERLAMADEQGAPASGINKASVEYRRLLTLVDPSATSSQLTTARVDHLERQAMADEQGAPAPSDAGDSSTPVSGWQLALSALAGALIGGGAVAASRTRRSKAPDSEPEHKETVAV